MVLASSLCSSFSCTVASESPNSLYRSLPLISTLVQVLSNPEVSLLRMSRSLFLPRLSRVLSALPLLELDGFLDGVAGDLFELLLSDVAVSLPP